MLRFSLRNLLVNKLRLLLTVAAVTVGVTFVSGSFVLSDTMVKAFDELYAGLTSGTDVVVRSEAAYDADVAVTGGQLPVVLIWTGGGLLLLGAALVVVLTTVRRQRTTV